MSNECILIIDPQKDFTHVDGAYAQRHASIYQIQNAKSKINQLLQTVDPQKVIIVFSNYAPNQFAPALSMCIPNTWGHELDINMHDAHSLFTKTEHSAFTSLALIAHLHKQGFNKIFLCGFLAEYCVQATALDALANGFSVSLLADCIGTADDKQEIKTEMLKELKEHNIEIVNSNVFLTNQ